MKAELEVGNVYINRGITGADGSRGIHSAVSKMSGGGTKAGDAIISCIFCCLAW